jgi:hypothetical protein
MYKHGNTKMDYLPQSGNTGISTTVVSKKQGNPKEMGCRTEKRTTDLVSRVEIPL